MKYVLEVVIERDDSTPMTGTVKVPEETPLLVLMYAAACFAAVVLKNMPNDSDEIMEYIRKQAITILTSHGDERIKT